MANKRRRRERYSLKRALGWGTQAVHEALYGQPLLHVNCNGALEIENCKGILRYDAGHLRLAMQGMEVDIEGDELVVGTYQKRLITVRGRIFSIRFYYNTHGSAQKSTG